MIHKNRQTIRLQNFDYAQNGAYFVTICAYQRKCVFGEVVNGMMVLNPLGKLVHGVWQQISQQYADVWLGEFIVMPNHLHGIIFIEGQTGANNLKGAINLAPTPSPAVGAQFIAPNPRVPNPKTPTLGEIVRAFKARCSQASKTMRDVSYPLWQRNYYEQVVRGEKSLMAMSGYVVNNPLQWHLDLENPDYQEGKLKKMKGFDQSTPYGAYID